MPRPETLDDTLSLVRRSRLVSDDRLDALLAELHGTTGEPPAPQALLGRLVSLELLTPYQAQELAVGRDTPFHFGPYRVLEKLGRGGMGHVYLCEHDVIGRQVAVKVLTSALQTDPGARKRFAREARASAAVDHPNVVRVFDVEATAAMPYLVMEFVDGVSWQAAVVRHGPFAPSEAAACGVQAALGLQAIADAGLIHRDIKPANLLVNRAGLVKILDLGIVRVDGEASITLDGGQQTILGTLDYLAPEQAIDSSAVDIRADLYALGSTLYFLLTGHPPFPDGDVEEKVGRKLSVDPPLLHQARCDVPPGLAQVVQRLLARDPADRYATPQEVAVALQLWVDTNAAFPGRLFAPPRNPAEPDIEPTTGSDSESTPSCATLRVIRPERVTATPFTPRRPAPRDDGSIDFNTPPTNPVPITGPDLYGGEPTGRLTPYRPTHDAERFPRRGWYLGFAALLLFVALLAWRIGLFAAMFRE